MKKQYSHNDTVTDSEVRGTPVEQFNPILHFCTGDIVRVTNPIGEEDRRYNGMFGIFVEYTKTGFASVDLQNNINVLLHPESLTLRNDKMQNPLITQEIIKVVNELIEELPANPNSILNAQVSCHNCSWRGSVNDCIPDVDGDGSLGCPVCEFVVS